MELAQLLNTKFAVPVADIDKAQAYQNRYGGRLEQILVNIGSLSSDNLVAVYCQFLDLPPFDLSQWQDWHELPTSNELNIQFLLKRDWLVLSGTTSTQWLIVAKDPLDWECRQYLVDINANFRLQVADEGDIKQLEQRHLQNHSTQLDIDHSDLSATEVARLKELATEAPTVNLVNTLITRAIKQGASDMHLEPIDGRYRARYRVDGVLLDAERLPPALQLAVISRVKILAGMDIAEKRRPQDGKIEMRIASVDLDIRVSALPLNTGESVVMRFLRKDSIRYDLSALGIAADTRDLIVQDIKRTAGVILLTGPTGSGKTTTLYSFLNQINNDTIKIITLEDPVEYQLAGVNQVQVQTEIGFDFATGLRSIVRQDPDVVMIGEIRDQETAHIAMQSALTGHLVFSTVHTNDAPGAYTRLLDLGVEEFLLNAAIVSIIAQRLVRRLCEHCAQPIADLPALLAQHGLAELAKRYHIAQPRIQQHKGCDACGHTGYKGRLAVIEYLSCDDTLKALPKDSSFLQAAHKHRAAQGWRSLLEDGMLKALQGLTTVDEVLRVVG